MKLEFFKNNWTRYYKRTFLLSFFIISLLCTVDQTLSNPLFFSKIESFSVFMFILSTIFFASIFCGLVSIIFLFLLSIIQ